MNTGCEQHTNFRSSGPFCPVCMQKEIEDLKGALGQASFYIRFYGPAGGDKEFTLRIIHAALGRLGGWPSCVAASREGSE